MKSIAYLKFSLHQHPTFILTGNSYGGPQAHLESLLPSSAPPPMLLLPPGEAKGICKKLSWIFVAVVKQTRACLLFSYPLELSESIFMTSESNQCVAISDRSQGT